MREIAKASVDYTNVEHLLANESLKDPNGVVVWKEIQSLVLELEATKLDLQKAQLEIAKLKLQKPPSRLGGSMAIIDPSQSVLFRDIQSLRLPRVVVDLTVRQVDIDDRTVTIVLPSDEDEIDPADTRAQIIVEFKGFSPKEYPLTYWSEKNGMHTEFNANLLISKDPQLATFPASDLARAADPSGDDVYLDVGGIKSNRIRVAPGTVAPLTPEAAQAKLLADFTSYRQAAWEALAPGTWAAHFDRVGWNGNEAIIIFKNGVNLTRAQIDSMTDQAVDRAAGVIP